MRNKLFIFFFIAVLSLFGQDKPKPEYYFGFRIISSTSSDLVRFGIITVYPNGNKKIRYLSKINFFLQVAGKQESIANKERINYWKEKKINAKVVNKLWKLKYAEYPYERHEDTEGWAQLRYAPSRGQLEFLKKYGYTKDISDFIYGENCFQLLMDVQNPEWQYEYSML